jgi:hypothetical protein
MELCCQVKKSLRRADHYSRGALPSVVGSIIVVIKPQKGRPWHGIESNRHRKWNKLAASATGWSLKFKDNICKFIVTSNVTIFL